MSGASKATLGANQLMPPTDGVALSGVHTGTATSSSTSAANLTLTIRDGGAYYSFQARGGDVYVRLKATATTAATTSGNGSNGYKIADGTTAHFWLGKGTVIVDHIASAACTLFWWQSSPNLDNRT